MSSSSATTVAVADNHHRAAGVSRPDFDLKGKQRPTYAASARKVTRGSQPGARGHGLHIGHEDTEVLLGGHLTPEV